MTDHVVAGLVIAFGVALAGCQPMPQAVQQKEESADGIWPHAPAGRPARMSKGPGPKAAAPMGDFNRPTLPRCRSPWPAITRSGSESAKEKSMLVRLPFVLILSALVSGCVSGPSGGQPPNYVETELTDSPIPRGSMVAMPDLPGDIGGPE